METGRCEYCNDPLPPQPKTGRRRRYCPRPKTCREAAYRERQHSLAAIPDEIAPPSGEVELLLAGRSAGTDEQIAGAILEARALVSVFSRLGREARPPFRWRCAAAADSIHAALTRYFGEAAE